MTEKALTRATLDEFKAHLISEERSETTVEKYMRDANGFLQFSKGEATKEKVIEYKVYLQEKYAVRSVNSVIAALNTLFSYMGRFDLRVKAVRLQREIYCPEDKELTKAEYVRLCRAAGKKKRGRLELLLQTICATGIRVGELKFITVEAARAGAAQVNCKGKRRTVFIVRDLKQKLLRYAAKQGIKSGMIFITRTGKALSRSNIWRDMKALCKEAQVSEKKVFPHNLRHLFARIFYAMEKDIARLADVLGHSSINTTRIYIISSGTEHRKRMENMHLII